MNDRDQQVDSALSNVAQRLARAIKTRCAQAMEAAAPEIEALRLEEEALQLRHDMSMAALKDEDEDDEDDDEEEGGAGRQAAGAVSMLEPLEGGEEDVL